MAFNATLKAGNIFVFEDITATEKATIEFDAPIKSMVVVNELMLEDDDGNALAIIPAGTKLNFVNRFGYPKYFNLVAGDAGVSPVFIVEEYGVSANDEYWAEEVEPEPEPGA